MLEKEKRIRKKEIRRKERAKGKEVEIDPLIKLTQPDGVTKSHHSHHFYMLYMKHNHYSLHVVRTGRTMAVSVSLRARPARCFFAIPWARFHPAHTLLFSAMTVASVFTRAIIQTRLGTPCGALDSSTHRLGTRLHG